MRRRRFLELVTLGSGLAAGCAGEDGSAPSRTAVPTTRATPRSTGSATPGSPTPGSRTTAPDTATPRQNPDAVFVDAGAGSNDATGARDDPVRTIQEGLDRARPGETVRLLPGRYFESPVTVRSGEAGSPITITGPPDAVVTPMSTKEGPNGRIGPLAIEHDHVHVRGCTFDGRIDPEQDELRGAYSGTLVEIRPPLEEGGYVEHVVLKPHAMGYAAHALVSSVRANHVEVGEFRVIGPAGLAYSAFGKVGHYAEIVYVGTALDNVGREGYPDSGIIDRSHDWHVHHVDASGGFDHAELVDVKAGAHDVLVEYCTSYGSGFATDKANPPAVNVNGHDCTVRWCDLSRGEYGVKIGTDYVWEGAQDNPNVRDNLTEEQEAEIRETAGTGNSIHGNRLLDHRRKAFAVPTHLQDVSDQAVVCGNEVEGPADGDPGSACPDSVPAGDGLGHTGGESPWGA